MPAQNKPGNNGPFRIDVNPQDPAYYKLPDQARPAATSANVPAADSPLIGDTSQAPISGLEVTQGWPHARPAEDPAETVEGDIIDGPPS